MKKFLTIFALCFLSIVPKAMSDPLSVEMRIEGDRWVDDNGSVHRSPAPKVVVDGLSVVVISEIPAAMEVSVMSDDDMPVVQLHTCAAKASFMLPTFACSYTIVVAYEDITYVGLIDADER